MSEKLFLNHLTAFILSLAPSRTRRTSSADKEAHDNVNETDYVLKEDAENSSDDPVMEIKVEW